MRSWNGILGAALVALALGGCVDTASEYRQYAAALQAEGKLRPDVDPADAPFSNDDLTRNFMEIAFFLEFGGEDSIQEVRTSTTLSRWEDGISYQVLGDGVGDADLREIQSLTKRLSRLTGRPFDEVAESPNLLILILDPEERDAFNNVVANRWGEDAARFQRLWADRLEYPCVGRIFGGGEITFAMVLIKDETEGIFRQSCIHEEIVQVLGLTNDSFEVRPSMFNDDEEFALLTRHDEYLLRILYDPRLRPGMSAEEAAPLVPGIVAELRPEGSS